MGARNKKKKKSGCLLPLLLLAVIAAGFYYYYISYEPRHNRENENVVVDTIELLKKERQRQEDFIKAATDTSDTTERIVIVSNPYSTKIPYDIDKNAGRPVRYVYTGRRINISVTGLDNRLGTRSNHADANHVISVLLDSGKIEIISVPRDTPADAGLEDTTGQNKLTVVRAVRGRKAYQEELARIAGVDKIHYWVEVGFSQVMGLLEFLGFRDTRSTLQVLRSRTGLGGADYQRSYNQGQFIRQMILRHFDKATGLSGEVLIRAALTVVETNLTTSVVKDIIDRLEAKGFPSGPEAVTVKIRPPMFTKFKVYDFTDENVIESLRYKIEAFNEGYIGDTLHAAPNVYAILRHRLDLAAKDSAEHPQRVINQLRIMFKQRAWLQIPDGDLRDSIRTEFGILLSDAYNKRRRPAKARQVWAIINAEKELLEKKIEN
jgi:hypothetical protein